MAARKKTAGKSRKTRPNSGGRGNGHFTDDQKAELLGKLSTGSLAEVKELAAASGVQETTIRKWADLAGVRVEHPGQGRHGKSDWVIAAALADHDAAVAAGSDLGAVVEKHGTKLVTLQKWAKNRDKVSAKAAKKGARAKASNGHANGASNGYVHIQTTRIPPGSSNPPSHPALALGQSVTLLTNALQQVLSAQKALEAFWQVFGEGGSHAFGVGMPGGGPGARRVANRGN
jgi:hypothetical protein